MTNIIEPEQTIELNEDKRELIRKAMADLGGAWNFMNDGLSRKDMTKEYAASIITAMEGYVERLGEILDVSTEKIEQEKERVDMIKGLNEARQIELDHLKAQISKGITPEGAKTVLVKFCEDIGKWWESLGLGSPYLHDSTISLRGQLSLKLSIDLDRMSSILSETPATDRMNHEDRLNKLGREYKLITSGGKDFKMLDCQENREKLVKLILKRFPGACISQFENHSMSRNDTRMYIRNVCVYVYEFL